MFSRRFVGTRRATRGRHKREKNREAGEHTGYIMSALPLAAQVGYLQRKDSRREIEQVTATAVAIHWWHGRRGRKERETDK